MDVVGFTLGLVLLLPVLHPGLHFSLDCGALWWLVRSGLLS